MMAGTTGQSHMMAGTAGQSHMMAGTTGQSHMMAGMTGQSHMMAGMTGQSQMMAGQQFMMNGTGQSQLNPYAPAIGPGGQAAMAASHYQYPQNQQHQQSYANRGQQFNVGGMPMQGAGIARTPTVSNVTSYTNDGRYVSCQERMEIWKILKVPVDCIALGKELGSGGNATTYKGTFSEQPCAVKKLFVKESEKRNVEREIRIMSW